MSVHALVSQLEAQGIVLWFEGDRLRFRAPHGRLTTEQRIELSAARTEVLAHLRARASARGTQGPASFNQRAIWVESQGRPDSRAYHVAFVARILSPIDQGALRHAVQALVDRHEALRTTLSVVDGELRQYVAGAASAALTIHDVESGDEQHLRALVEADYRRPFVFETGPLFRVSLYTRAPDDHVLLLAVHHSVVDGWSLFQLVDEFGSLYLEGTGGAPATLARSGPQYLDFTAWQAQMLAGEEGARLGEYWQGRLAAPRTTVEVPPDRPRSPYTGDRGATMAVEIDGPLCVGLRQLARSADATLFAVLLAAFKALLARTTHADDVIVGTPMFGRSRQEFAQVVGNFVNVVPLRTRVDVHQSFRVLLRDVQETVQGGIDAQDFPLSLIVERARAQRGADRTPLFSPTFLLQRFDELRALEGRGTADGGVARSALGGLRLEPFPLAQQQGQFDVGFELFEWREAIRGELRFDGELYDAATMEVLRRHFVTLLESVVRHPDASLASLPLVDAEERARLVWEWNATASAYPAEVVCSRLIEAQVAARPGAVAVTSASGTLTYGELNTRANQVARRLQALGVGPGVVVGVWLPRTPDVVVALLGVQKAGGAYVPLDPEFPAERVRLMVADSGAQVVIAAGGAPEGPPVPAGVTVLDLAGEAAALAALPGTNLATSAGPADLCYVLYTSGSTGHPNGVRVSHQSLVNFVWQARTVPGLGPDDVVGAVASVSFDISGFDVYAPLVVGARVELIARATAMDGAALAGRLAAAGVTTLVSTPATWRLLVAAGWQGGPGFRALCGGEPWGRDLAEALLPRVGALWNLYGPTETTIWSTAERVEPGGGPIGMGHPLANTQVYVVDADGALAPTGVAGELWIGGDGVALGYHGRPALTAARFQTDPFRGQGRVYRSGDRGRWRADGRLEYLGRLDQQVKIRGYRIELGEIEATLARHAAVAQAVVQPWTTAEGDRRLAAYVVLHPGATLTWADMAAHVRRTLPDYMLPSALEVLAALPLSPTGKIDRRALPRPSLGERHTASESEKATSPATATEVAVAAMWGAVLGLESVPIDRNFFELGGHSLTAARILTRVRTTFSVDVPLHALFDAPTVAEFSRVVDAATAAQAAAEGPRHDVVI